MTRSQSSTNGTHYQSPFDPVAVDLKCRPQDPDRDGYFESQPSYLRRHICGSNCKYFDPVGQKSVNNRFSYLVMFR